MEGRRGGKKGGERWRGREGREGKKGGAREKGGREGEEGESVLKLILCPKGAFG